jgi:molybdopterin converting factor small subunit
MSSAHLKDVKEEITVKLKYLTVVRDMTGLREESVNFPMGSTLQEVAVWLRENHGLSLPDPGIMTILNGKGWGQFPTGLATQIKEEDVICLFPPISGG